jgi:hypothetical protein
VGKSEGKKLLEIPRRMCEDNIKTYLKAQEWGVLNSIYLAQNRDQKGAFFNTIIYFEVTQNIWNFLNSLVTGDSSRRIQLHGISYFFREKNRHEFFR